MVPIIILLLSAVLLSIAFCGTVTLVAKPTTSYPEKVCSSFIMLIVFVCLYEGIIHSCLEALGVVG